MKVGTDGVLLGAWAPMAATGSVLDVGTGSGLIALMAAQRAPAATITAVELDREAAAQAAENVARSPWSNRIAVVCDDFRRFQAPRNSFDLILSNPPYYIDALHSPGQERTLARHTTSLNYPLLIGRAAGELLSAAGVLALIIPSAVEQEVMRWAATYHLHLHRRLRIRTKTGKPFRRVLLALGRCPAAEILDETLCILAENGAYTPEYIALTRDFYLTKRFYD